MTIVGINRVGSELAAVVAKMKVQGRPTIRVILHNNRLYAIEGTHRLAAAKQLGLRPVIVIVADDTTDPHVIVRRAEDERDRTVAQLRASYIPESHLRDTFHFGSECE